MDKSMLIGQMLDQNDNGVFLYTRPRRFGKSLNLSMIDAFFNVKYEGNRWFDGLEISDYSKYERYKNSFPVISIDLKTSDVTSLEKFIEVFNKKLSAVMMQFEYLLESPKLSEKDKGLLEILYSRNKTVTDSEYALRDLSVLLEKHHGTKTVVLIDEYDAAINTVSDANLRRDIISFLREMMSSLLKGNDSLQMAVVTGILQITKENIFSGLNNLYVNNILSERFDEMFGFTDAEVERMCADYGHPEKFAEAKEWYDEYRFGNTDIYNPWSILNYIQEGFKPAPYWANTSGNTVIADLLKTADRDVLDDLKALGSGESIPHGVTATLTFDDLDGNKDAIYSLMVLSGYLKAIPEGRIQSRLEREVADIPHDRMLRAFGHVDGELVEIVDGASALKWFVRGFHGTSRLGRTRRRVPRTTRGCRLSRTP